MKRRAKRSWRVGAFGSALALGLRDTLQPKEPVPIVIDEPGDDLPDGGIVLFFHPQVPEATLVLVR